MFPRPSTSQEASPGGRGRRGRASSRSAAAGQRTHRSRKVYQRRGFWAAVGLTVLGGSVVAVNTASAGTVAVDTSSWYLLVNRNTGEVLDNLEYGTADGAPVVQWTRNGGDNQQWKFVDSGDGNYRLQNRSSGKVLDDFNWSKNEGAELVQWHDLNGANQQFHLEKSSDGYVRLINRSNGKAVEVPLGSKSDGGRIAQYHDWNGANQQWQLVPVGSAGGTGNAGASGGSAAPTTSAKPGSSAAPSQTPSGNHPTSAAPTSPPAPVPAAGGGSSSGKTFMGSTTVLIGGSVSDASAGAAPFDAQYAYVHSQPAPSSDYYTAARCQDAWTGWWGCWNGSTTAPGTYVTWRDAKAAQETYQGKPRPQKFLWTWYSLRDLGDAAGQGDGPGEVKAINRADLLTRYLNDYRFFLQKIGTSHDMIDLEPDFWGYVRSLGDPHQVAAQVKAANPTDCGSQENSAAGLAQCLISMGHKYAPNAAVGMHLSCFDWQQNTPQCVKDYASLGAQNADFLATDVSDRDAGWYAQPAHGGLDKFWNDQSAAAQMGFYKTMAESVGKPVVLWQIPVGNMAQNNTLNHYKDDKVDWFFAHMDQVANAHIAGLMFGPGQQEQTSAETDGGNLINKTTAYHNSGGTPLK
ncbi:lectin [Streptomyces tateyamensis]|uniref:Lectin n=1 Tax=Streptomyces tateyamensis TaxID=565073 RepID=A0A2V4NMU6_9ACTN|nr:RICIN domain-containing protein [Streptomyces tateyamensis]PYC87892.1 lectin [Streptomyces tateyamensis]